MCMKVRHETEGRWLAPADNSPAHWLMIQIFSDAEPSLDYIRQHLEQIPMTQRMSAREAEGCDFRRTLDEFDYCGTLNWYLAHRTPICLGRIGNLTMASFPRLRQHFIEFMSPSNMCLVAKELAGLAELDFFFESKS